MKRAIHDIRVLLSELMLRWALSIMPDTAPEKFELADALDGYAVRVQEALESPE